MNEVSFSKYSGCGNDFLAIDNRLQVFPQDNPELIQRLCHRQNGIGADGILLLETSENGDFKMRIFNSDGQEASMCGNGLRCIGAFIQELGYPQKPYSIATMHRNLMVEAVQASVKAAMGTPSLLQENVKLKVANTEISCTVLDTGVPHAVIFVEDLEKVAVTSLGKQIRFHPLFSPYGVNATFAQKKSEQKLEIRTYERGVEGETLACGTGAVAAAIAASLQFGFNSPVQVTTRSKDCLIIEFEQVLHGTHKEYRETTQTGPALKTFEGRFNILNFSS